MVAARMIAKMPEAMRIRPERVSSLVPMNARAARAVAGAVVVGALGFERFVAASAAASVTAAAPAAAAVTASVTAAASVTASVTAAAAVTASVTAAASVTASVSLDAAVTGLTAG